MFLDGDNTLSIPPSFFDKLMEVGDEMREDKLGSSVSVARPRSEASSIRRSSTVYSRVLGQLSQLQQVLSNSLWALRPLCMRSVSSADDVTVKAYVQADLGWVQGSHCTDGGWRIRSETYLECSRRRRLVTTRGSYVNGILWNYEVPGSLRSAGIGRMSLEGRQLPIL